MTLNEYTVTEIKRIFDIVKEKRFLMLKGATGTGKTLYAHALACLLVERSEEKKEELFGEKLSYHGGDEKPYDSVYHNVKINEKYKKYLGEGWVRNVIFHKATSRENFVYGISVATKDSQLRFESRKRVFLEAVEAANNDKDCNFVIILDDIGRADFSAVMGDLLSALESMGDGNTFRADEKCGIPQNLYIIATYNPAVAASTVDYAWYRRFFVYELNPDERYIIKSKDTIWKNNSIFALYGENGEMRTDYKGFSNFRSMDVYQRFMDYVYVLFMHVKILFEKYSTDPDVRNLYIPGHGMFLTYVEGKSSKENSFKENIDTFHSQLRHVIVPLLYHCLHTGLLDQRAAFDIDLLEHLWEDGYGEITLMGESKGERRDQENWMINLLIKKFPASITYFFFLRNPLVMRIAHLTPNRYFLFEKNGEHYNDPRSGAENYHLTERYSTRINGLSSLSTNNILRPYYSVSKDYVIPKKKQLIMKETTEQQVEDYIEDCGQIYPAEVFLTLYKAAVKLLAIAKSKKIDEIWTASDHNLEAGPDKEYNKSLDKIFCRYKNNRRIKDDDFQPGIKQIENGTYRIIKLCKAFEGLFPDFKKKNQKTE